MRTTLAVGALAAALALLAGCQAATSSTPTPGSASDLMQTLRIWPVGDSITAGASDSWKVWSPENGGYRRNLMLMLNDGYSYDFIGGITADDPPGDNLPPNHSGYRGEGLSVFAKPEFNPDSIAANKPDAVLLLLGINSLGSKKEYPDTQGGYYSKNGNKFNSFFVQYKAFVDKLITNAPQVKVFIAKLPPIGDTRFYQTTWDDTAAWTPTGWTTVGDGTVNPKDIVPEFNTELQALYDTYYASNSHVVLVDQNTGMSVGTAWESDVCQIGVPQNWWNGDGLHPTPTGYRHLAERWNAALRTAFPTNQKVLYSVDCGAIEGTASVQAEGATVGASQSAVWDKAYGPDPVTGKSWGHVGVADWGSLSTHPADASLYFAWETSTDVSSSVATATAGHDLVYRFEVPAGGSYRVFLGFHDTWGENASPKSTSRSANVYLDGTLEGLKAYTLNDFGRNIYDVVNSTGTLEVKVAGFVDNPLLDSIAIQRLR
ncbi:MAG TPA: GDSL-type esterase/lipase family protein [Spirochaetia bacterium]|nr:GDSL-type esterase/lipase family protein [Spirochaetia bacterium]